MLVRFISALVERYGAPVVVGGDFNFTKVQSDDNLDSSGVKGAFWHLCGKGSAEHDCRQSDTDDEVEAACADTWVRAKANGRADAQGCISSTCHAWKGDNPAEMHLKANTQSVGGNSLSAEDGSSTRSKNPFNRVSTTGKLAANYGNKRFIDWLLLDRRSLAKQQVSVEGATVHTQYGLSEAKLRAMGADLSRLPIGSWKGSHGLFGSDHYPISVDLKFKGRA